MVSGQTINPMKNFIVKSYGELDLTVTYISDYDISTYIHDWIHRYEYGGPVSVLAHYLDTIAIYGKNGTTQLDEIDGICIFTWNHQCYGWIQAENSFDAVYKYHKLFKKIRKDTYGS